MAARLEPAKDGDDMFAKVAIVVAAGPYGGLHICHCGTRRCGGVRGAGLALMRVADDGMPHTLERCGRAMLVVGHTHAAQACTGAR